MFIWRPLLKQISQVVSSKLCRWLALTSAVFHRSTTLTSLFCFFCGAECLWRLRVATGLLFTRVLISFYFNIPDFFSGFARVHAVCSLIFWPRNVVGRGICYALVCLSVRPSVCLSHAWITPEGSKIFKYALYHTYDRAMFRVSWGQIFTFEFRGSPQRVR